MRAPPGGGGGGRSGAVASSSSSSSLLSLLLSSTPPRTPLLISGTGKSLVELAAVMEDADATEAWAAWAAAGVARPRPRRAAAATARPRPRPRPRPRVGAAVSPAPMGFFFGGSFLLSQDRGPVHRGVAARSRGKGCPVSAVRLCGRKGGGERVRVHSERSARARARGAGRPEPRALSLPSPHALSPAPPTPPTPAPPRPARAFPRQDGRSGLLHTSKCGAAGWPETAERQPPAHAGAGREAATPRFQPESSRWGADWTGAGTPFSTPWRPSRACEALPQSRPGRPRGSA